VLICDLGGDIATKGTISSDYPLLGHLKFLLMNIIILPLEKIYAFYKIRVILYKFGREGIFS
jgi:hypothetical protein